MSYCIFGLAPVVRSLPFAVWGVRVAVGNWPAAHGVGRFFAWAILHPQGRDAGQFVS